LTHAIWGEQDLLFPIEQLEAAQVKFPDFIKTIRQIDGGAHFHPIERPWSIADAIHQILTN
jgi:pimeloyl-ACP methyl ester carboxylesterase